MEHIRHPAETIGPRRSSTPQESEAARYAARYLKDLGLEPAAEPFTGRRRDGVLQERQRPSDTMEHPDPQVVKHTEAFIWEMLQNMDRE